MPGAVEPMLALYPLIAIVMGLAGLGLVFAGWQRLVTGSWKTAVVAAGWALLFGSIGVWVADSGPELGVTLALLVPSVLAWLLVLGNRQLRQRRERTSASNGRTSVAERPWLRHLALFVLVVPGAGVACTLASVALSRLLPWEPVNAMVLVFIVLPLLWGGLAYWACADSRLARPTLVSLAGALLSAAVIYG